MPYNMRTARKLPGRTRNQDDYFHVATGCPSTPHVAGKVNLLPFLAVLTIALFLFAPDARAATTVYISDVPDYSWYYGCAGTAAGNLFGYWDRHGLPDFYTGPLNGGVAPLTTVGANKAIVSLWASKAGQDGRPASQPGHVDDYYVAYENVEPDPFVTAQRPEHPPDCIGDFIGLNQLKWTNMANECDGNIDGYAFVYWATNGDKRVDFTPTTPEGDPVPDVQSGLRAWTRYRGYDASVFTQLTDFNPAKPATAGFTFEDLKAEIDAGYPVLLSLQNFFQTSRVLGGRNVNPVIHTMLAFGYMSTASYNYVLYKTSWGEGDHYRAWNSNKWEANLPVRGVIGYHPLPKLTSFSISGADLQLGWHGPVSDVVNSATGITNRVHGYIVEMSTSSPASGYVSISPVLLTNSFTVTNCPTPAFFRVELVKP